MIFGKLFRKIKEPEGYIAHFDLNNWWQSSFTEDERNYIVETFQPLGVSKDILVKGRPEMSDSGPLSFLTSLTSWFDNPRDRKIAYKIISKAQEYINFENHVLNLHFFYSTKMKLFYKEREKNSEALEIAIDSCLKQVELAKEVAKVFKHEYGGEQLPAHEGYKQLCIILEKQGKYEEAIKFARQAKKQCWSGNWNNRIERCKKKLEKQSSKL